MPALLPIDFTWLNSLQKPCNTLEYSIDGKVTEDENKAIEIAKKQGKKHKPILLSNGDTKKQLLARSRYILAKKMNDWTENQKQRAELLFSLYPKIEKAYKHTLEFRSVYEEKCKTKAKQRFENWFEDTEELEVTPN